MADRTPVRPRLSPPWLLLVLAAMVMLVLYAAWPTGGLRERVETAPTSDLSVAYLEAWSRVQPDNEALLALLGRRYRQLGRLDDALRIAQRMDHSSSAEMRRSAVLLRLGIDEQKAFAYPEGSSEREAALSKFRAQLHAAAALKWQNEELHDLAVQAAAAGAPALARDLYARLSKQDAGERRRWDHELARYATETGAYSDAAAAWFRLESSAPTLDERRDAFIAGIRALQSGNMLDEAVDAAQQNVGVLANDKETLIVLLNLARAAHRPDLVARYAKALAKYASTSTPEDTVPRRELATFESRRATGRYAQSSFAYMDGPQGGNVGHFVRVAMATASSGEADVDVASLVYQAFLESGDLDDAQKIAAKQVERHPNSALWLKRLAQVAEWNHASALALKTWLAYARVSNDPQGWQTVQRMAPMLDDDEAYLDSVVHASNSAPDDMKLVDAVTSTYERLGRPEDALAFLRAHRRGSEGEAIDARYATLAERAGHDDIALATYRSLLAKHPYNTVYALRAASILYRHDDFSGAYAVLQKAHDSAKDNDILYWRNYAELARLLQQTSGANDAYQHMLASGNETPDDLTAMTYFYGTWPRDAGRTAELEYRRDGTVHALQIAVYNYTVAREWGHVSALLSSLTPKQRAAAEGSAQFLATRAEYYRQIHRASDALRDLERAVTRPDATLDNRAALLWTLADYGEDTELHKARRQWCARARQTPALWGACAAADLREERPVQALALLRLQTAAMSRDPLWLLTYANAEELAGRPDLARLIELHVWRDLERERRAPSGPRRSSAAVAKTGLLQDEDEDEQLRGRRVTLAQMFERADVSLALLDDLLASDAGGPDRTEHRRSSDNKLPATAQPEQRTLLGNAPGVPPLGEAQALPGSSSTVSATAPTPVGPREAQALADGRLKSAVAKDVALAWALSQEANPLAKRWLAQQYANRLAQPAEARLTIALADGDTATIERLMDTKGVTLSTSGRIDAAVALDRPAQAEDLAFEGVDDAPDNTDMHTRLVDTALAWPQAMDAQVSNHVEHPLDYTEIALDGSIKVAEHYMVGVNGVQRFERSADETQLVNVPGIDRSINFFIERQTQNSSVTVSGGRREGLDSFYNASIAAEVGRNSPLSLTVQAGRNQTSTESPVLLVGGMKDNLTGALLWNVTPRFYMSGNVEADRFYSQARNSLGSGVLSTGEIGYRIRTTYPDYTIRVVGIRGDYSGNVEADSLISQLLPAGSTPTAGTIVPQTYAEYGIFAGFGTNLREQYTHAWRPFADFGIVHDSLQGWGPQVNAGLAGSVFGGDHAALYVEYQRVSAIGTSVMVVGGRYSWFY